MKYKHLVTAERLDTKSRVEWCVLLDDTPNGHYEADIIVNSIRGWTISIRPAESTCKVQEDIESLQYWDGIGNYL